MSTLTPGRIVQYRLSESDCDSINRRRGATPHLTFHGNLPRAGQVVPCIVVWPSSETCFNGQAFLDGNDTHWVTSVLQGTGPGTWSWPVRSE